MAATYTGLMDGATFAAGKSMATLWNGSGSGKIVKVYRIFILNNQLSAISGILTNMEIRKITNTSGGSNGLVIKHDSNSAAVPSEITFTTGSNDTISNLLKTVIWSTDEPLVGGNSLDEYEMIPSFNIIWDIGYGDSNITPLTLREGEGVTVKHSGSFSQGQCDIIFEFTLE